MSAPIASRLRRTGVRASFIVRYAAAIATVTLALLVTLTLNRPGIRGTPFTPAIMLTTWYGGLGPGLFAVALSLLTMDYFVVTPVYSLRPVTLDDAWYLIVFTVSAVLVAWLTGTQRRTAAALQAAHDDLTARVQDLAVANAKLHEEVLERGKVEAEVYKQASLLDLTHDSIFARNLDDVITYWNRGSEQRYGWSRTEAVGQVSHQLMRTVFPAPLAEIESELRRTGEWEGELVHTTRDGARVVVASRWSLQRDELARPAGVLETNNDVTERKRAEEQLRESERRYRNIFQTVGVSIWQEDFSRLAAAIDDLKAQGVGDFRQHLARHPGFLREAISMVKIVDVNDISLELFAAESKEELLVSLNEIFVPETWKVFEDELITLAEGRTSFQAETDLRTLKGEKLTVLITITFPAPPARLDNVLVTLTDITERTRAEYLTTQVFEASPDGVCILGRDHRCQRANAVIGQIWGMPPQKALGMHLADVLEPNAFEQSVKPALERCFAGEEVRYAAWIMTKGLGRRYLAVSYSPLRPSSNRVETALLILRDLTDHMQAWEALREAQAELARVTRVTMLGELTASIAHEVNQPLAAVVMNGNACRRWLAADPPDLDEARQAAQRVVKDGVRAGEVLARIRALVRRGETERDAVDVNDVIREALGFTRTELERQKLAVHTELSDGLPAVVADRVQLQQVLVNLILNARDAMADAPEPSGDLTVRSRRGCSGEVLVEVEDCGRGIDQAQAERIFEAFFSTKPAGLGMGLSVSRSIIEMHGGRIWATDNEGRGATMRFTLPPARLDTPRADGNFARTAVTVLRRSCSYCASSSETVATPCPRQRSSLVAGSITSTTTVPCVYWVAVGS
jgi:PAS domain S-box-containing protein